MPAGSSTYIDLFAGAGGISLGLHNAGWKGLFAIEKSDMAFETLHYNLIENKDHFAWPDWLPIKEHDIDKVLENYRPELLNLRGKVDLIAGGPPCQGFSLAGRRNRNDERNQLVHSYLKFIEHVKPKALFLENVTGFKSGFKYDEKRERAYSEFVKEKLEKIGYNVDHDVIDFSEYGIPQKRKRFILVGFKEHKSEYFFEQLTNKKNDFLKNKGLKENNCLGDAISDLEKRHGLQDNNESRFDFGVYGPSESEYQKYMKSGEIGECPDSHRFANHYDSTIERNKYIIENCEGNTDVDQEVKEKYKLKKHSLILLDKDQPCPTLTTLPDDYIHYSEPRILTVREYARIQSFPDWYEIKNKYTTGGKRRRVEVPRYSQMGNAVPPLFAEQVGQVLKELV